MPKSMKNCDRCRKNSCDAGAGNTAVPIDKREELSDVATAEVPNSTDCHEADALTDEVIEAVASTVANESLQRSCWICFESMEDNNSGPWVSPCRCRGTTKWVHQNCLRHWVDVKQAGNALRTVRCPQCRTKYRIVMPPMGQLASFLEALHEVVKSFIPYVVEVTIAASVHWTALGFSLLTIWQIVGHEEAVSLIKADDPLTLYVALPAIPFCLVLGRMIPWQDKIIHMLRSRRGAAGANTSTHTVSQSETFMRDVCAALFLPTVSNYVGKVIFSPIENPFLRTILGGVTYILVKGFLKICYRVNREQWLNSRRIADYPVHDARARNRLRINSLHRLLMLGGGRLRERI